MRCLLACLGRYAGKRPVIMFKADQCQGTCRCMYAARLGLRVESKHRDKFEPSAAPALFCGWRLDSGPESFKEGTWS